MPIIKVDAFKCNKCNYVWLSRQYLEDKKTIPIACSRCKSSYWNRDPTTTTTTIITSSSKDKKKKKRGK